MSNLKNFYFTFGSEEQIYRGGWIIIRALDETDARLKFMIHFGEEAYNENGFLRFAFSYDEESFMKTSMAEKGNLGAYCHEVVE